MFHHVMLAVLLGTGADAKIDARIREDYNHLRMPAHGTVYKGTLYGFFDDEWAQKNKDGSRNEGQPAYLDGIALDKIGKMNWQKYPFRLAGNNLRHHVGHGALWFSRGHHFLNRWEFDRIPEFLKRSFGPSDATGGDMVISGIVLNKLGVKYDKIGSLAADPKKLLRPGEVPRPIGHLVGYESVPISKSSCKTFFLTKKEKKFEAWETHGVMDRAPGPFKMDQRLGPNQSAPPEIKNLETFDSAFTEDFYAFIRKNDYYFVTESGKLYYAPAPADGAKTRKMRALWNEALRPIVAVIEDADRGNVWLFAKDKSPGAKLDLYFEMKETIRPESFDPAKLTPSKVEGRAKLLLEYLPLISADAKK
jgi:hypothetical protein